jgi:hypothetical protein
LTLRYLIAAPTRVRKLIFTTNLMEIGYNSGAMICEQGSLKGDNHRQ